MHSPQERDLSENKNAIKISFAMFLKELYLRKAGADELVATVVELNAKPRKVQNLKDHEACFHHLNFGGLPASHKKHKNYLFNLYKPRASNY